MKQLIGLDLKTIDAIAVTSGPGSFTGLRIGVTTAKALALALEVPIIGIPTLDVMAYNIIHSNSVICPIMDARRNQVYTALYRWEEKILRRLTDYNTVDIEEYLEEIKAHYEKVVFLGDGVWQYQSKIKGCLAEKAEFAPSYLNLQRAGTLVQLASYEYDKGNAVDASEFVPMYLRKSQAEREREEREKDDH
jgi:tRNA threonylcarbamoyladenosine biosynthesis protein TsaB